MTTQEFINEARNYYGKPYTQYQFKVVVERLNQIPDNLKQDILKQIFKVLSLKFKSVPGISEIEDALKIVRDQETEEEAHNFVKAEYCDKCGTLKIMGICRSCECPTADEVKELFDNLPWRTKD